MRLFAELLAAITGHPRMRVVARWSNTFWVSNIFAAWEQVAWRRNGIRLETTGYHADGKTVQFAHTWEAAFCLFEMRVREFLKTFKLAPIKIYVPMMQLPMGIRIPASPYLFAVSLTNGPTFSGSNSYSFTVTAGSNLALVSFIDSLNNDTTACSYNSAAMTQVNSAVSNPSTDHFTMWQKVAPSTGANTLTATTSGNSYRGLNAVAYSGVDQTTPINGSAVSASTSSVSITTTVTGCFFAGNAFTSGTLSIPYTTFTSFDGINLYYTTAGQGSAGATTCAVTNVGGTPTLVALAVAPVAAAGPANVKTWDAVTQSTGIKTYIGVALASVKSVIGVV